MALTLRPRKSQAFGTVPEAERFLGDELLAVPTTVGGTALASVPSGARHAYLVNLDTTNKVILRLNATGIGGNPDATHGIPLAAGVAFDLTSDPAQVKLLAVTSAVNVFVSYFGEP
jgi:hypothetical protein